MEYPFTSEMLTGLAVLGSWIVGKAGIDKVRKRNGRSGPSAETVALLEGFNQQSIERARTVQEAIGRLTDAISANTQMLEQSDIRGEARAIRIADALNRMEVAVAGIPQNRS